MKNKIKNLYPAVRSFHSVVQSDPSIFVGISPATHLRLIYVMLVVALWLSSCQPVSSPETPPGQPVMPTSGIRESPTAEASQKSSPTTPPYTISPTPSETNPVTQTAQISTSTEFPELKAELFAFFGGGGPSCAYGPSQSNRPEIEILSPSFPAPAQDTILCLFNFPLNAEVTVEMRDPSGHLAEQRIYRVGNQKFENEDALEVTLLEIPISFPLTLPQGTWRILAYSGGVQAEKALSVGEYSPAEPEFRPGAPIVTHSPMLPDSDTTPLNSQLRAPYRAGDIIQIRGVHFPPNATFGAGLYQGWTSLSLINSFSVTTDQRGSFAYDLTLENNLPSGGYSIIPSPYVADESVNEDYYPRFYVQNELVRLLGVEGCQKETNLVVGGMAYLADQEANNLRLSPGSDGLRTGRLQPDERVVILDGPECADGFVWWDVQSLDTNLLGWTAEGDGNEAWLLQLP